MADAACTVHQARRAYFRQPEPPYSTRPLAPGTPRQPRTVPGGEACFAGKAAMPEPGRGFGGAGSCSITERKPAGRLRGESHHAGTRSRLRGASSCPSPSGIW